MKRVKTLKYVNKLNIKVKLLKICWNCLRKFWCLLQNQIHVKKFCMDLWKRVDISPSSVGVSDHVRVCFCVFFPSLSVIMLISSRQRISSPLGKEAIVGSKWRPVENSSVAAPVPVYKRKSDCCFVSAIYYPREMPNFSKMRTMNH